MIDRCNLLSAQDPLRTEVTPGVATKEIPVVVRHTHFPGVQEKEIRGLGQLIKQATSDVDRKVVVNLVTG